MNKKTKLKRIALAVLSLVSVVSLASCKETKTTSIKTNDVYASTTLNGKTYTLTNGELWNELKWNSSEIISDKINEIVLEDYKNEVLDTIKVFKGDTTEVSVETQKRYFDYMEQQAFTSIFGTDSYDNLANLSDKTKNKNVLTYIDTAYVEDGKSIDASTLDEAYLLTNAKVLFDGTSLETTYYLYNFYEDFADTCAQRALAFQYLDDYIVDYNAKRDADNYYYTDEDIIQYHSENYQYAEDRQAIIIRFTNTDEITSTLKAFGVKTYNDSFYFIPQGSKTNTEYSKYYDDFDVSKAANSEKCFNIMAIGGESAIFEFYLAMYNYIYTYRDALPLEYDVRADITTNKRNITESIIVKYIKNDSTVDPSDVVAAWSELDKKRVNYTQEDLNDIDADFKFYVSKKLKVDANYVSGESRYSISGQSYNDHYYMVFKISEDSLRNEYVLLNDIDDTTIPESKSEYKQKLIHEMMWDELTDSYISDALGKKIENVKTYIFEPEVEIAYSAVNTSYSKTHKNAPSSDTLFTLKYNGKKMNVSINEVFEKLVLKNGVTTTIDLLSKKVIKDTTEYADTNKNRKDYENTIELLLAYFANGQLSSYPSSLGKYNFLMLYFHSSDIDDIIDNYYRVNEASNKILTDFGNNDKFYNLVMKYSEEKYEKHYTATASNLLVYVDMDEDGKPDKDFDWNKVVPTSPTKTYQELAVELVQYMITRMKNSKETQLSSLNTMVSEYTSCQRFTNGIDVYDPDNNLGVDDYDPTEPETIWAEYKRAGLYVEVTEYTDVTNSTAEAESTDGSCPLEIKNKIKELYNSVKYNNQFPGEYVDSSSYEGTNATGWQTTKGFSMVILSSAKSKNSAKFESKDDVNGIYTNISVIYDENKLIIPSIYNENDTATKEQIQLFVYEYLKNQESTMFPTSVQSYFTDYVKPVYEKYVDSSTQRELLFIKLLGSSITFGDASNTTRLNKIRDINQRISDEYLEDTDDAFNFAGWWDEILKLKD